MEFAYPAAFAGLAAIPILFLLNLYRYRRLRVTVGSLIVWKRLSQHAETPPSSKQRYFNLSLLMQILFVILLTTALAGPRVTSADSSGRIVHIVIDRSASTEANSAGSRVFDRILLEASRLLKSLSPGDLVRCHASPGQAQLQSAGPFPPAEAQGWLNSLSPEQLEGDPAAAAKIAAALAVRENSQVFLFTDSEKISVPAVVHVCAVPADPGNLGLVSAAAAYDTNGLNIFFRIANFSLEEKTPLWTVNGVSGRRYAESAESPEIVKPGMSLGVNAILPAEASGEQILEIRLTAKDSLLSDNIAYIFRNPVSELNISYIGRENPDLVRALSSLPGSVITRAESPADDCSLAIFYEVSPPDALTCNAVVISPPEGVPGLVKTSSSDVFEPPAPLDGTGSDLATTPEWAERLAVKKALKPVILKQTLAKNLLVDASGTELMVSFTRDKYRLIYVGFALEDTNWNDQVSFPVFWGLLAEQLGGLGEEWITVKTGGSVTLSSRELDNILAPDNRELPQPHSGMRAVFSPQKIGIYTADYSDDDKLFAASLLSPAESKLESSDIPFDPAWLKPVEETKKLESDRWFWHTFAFAAAFAMLASWLLWRERKKA